MRIISKFHDYYDSASAWRDEDLLYVRKTSDPISLAGSAPTELTRMLQPILSLYKAMPEAYGDVQVKPYKRSNYFARPLVLVFCGKAYPLYEMFADPKDKHFYDLDKMIAHCESLRTGRGRVQADLLRGEGRKSRRSRYLVWKQLNTRTWGRFKENNLKEGEVSPDIHRYLRTPVFAVGPYGEFGTLAVVKNPMLRDYNFMTQVDPYTAFQEISMYVGNDLVNQMDATLTRTDEDIRDSKGMDKWSFRKPGKKGMY